MPIIINSTEIEVPLSELRFRKRNENVFSGMKDRGESLVTSIVAAGRMKNLTQKSFEDLTQPSLRNMAYWKMKDIDLSAKRIMQAKQGNETIGLVTDFDVDGISSAAVMYLALTEYMGIGKEYVQIHINNRMKYGYGFNEKALDAIMERAGNDMPTLLITADQGSNDNETVRLYKKRMAELGVENADVIITDHHHIKKGETCPEAAAFVNPQRPDDDFDDPTICGCVVALLVMSAAREYMRQEGVLPEDTPRLTPLLTYASLATVADCVSLKSGYNRCIIRKGLSDINKEVIPAWSVLKKRLNKPMAEVTAMDLGFTLGPAINADSRTGGDGSDAINFLLSKTIEEAEYFYDNLQSRNSRRKEIDHAMQEAALKEASHQYFEKDMRGLCIYLPKGSHGIHGIVASRVKERFHCPVIIFSPVDVNEKNSEERVITGSGRCIDGMNIISMVQDDVGQEVELLGSGGHTAAMGLKMKLGNLKAFQKAFDDVVKKEGEAAFSSERAFEPHVLVDHLFQEDELTLLDSKQILNDIKRLEPYGQKFEPPVFAINGVLTSTSRFGKGKNLNAHLTLVFKDNIGRLRKAVAFNYEKQPWIDELAVGESYTFAVTLTNDTYNNCVGMLIESVSTGVNAITKA
jgi:single-stranded-DNA-specific exonuclease